MMGHKIRFKGKIWKIIPKLSLLPFLSGALVEPLNTERPRASTYLAGRQALQYCKDPESVVLFFSSV